MMYYHARCNGTCTGYAQEFVDFASRQEEKRPYYTNVTFEDLKSTAPCLEGIPEKTKGLDQTKTYNPKCSRVNPLQKRHAEECNRCQVAEAHSRWHATLHAV
jgi:hypothetical protein